jgi:hypothetical protein
MIRQSLIVSSAVVWMWPAFATELPREVTCRFVTKVEGTQLVDELNSATVEGIARWDEIRTPGEKNCGNIPLPTMEPSHCYGLSESNRDFVISTGYCVEIDQDGDKIIWKINPVKIDQFYSVSTGTSEVLIGGGKYAGVAGKEKWQCTYGASALKYNALCHIEQTLKFPAKE